MAQNDADFTIRKHPDDAVVIVTGAGSGIGQATAILAARQGYRVAGWDINVDGVARTIKAAGDVGAAITPVECDVADGASIKAAMQASAALGSLVGLVNNAGPVAIGREPDFAETVKDAIASVQMVSEAFLAQKPGPDASVVGISSIVGPILAGGASWYCAAKAGIVGYIRNMAVLNGGEVRFNVIAPGGPVRTPRNASFIDDGVFDERIKRNPTGRPGNPIELAAAIMFLISPASSYVNGVLLPVDGGLSAAE